MKVTDYTTKEVYDFVKTGKWSLADFRIWNLSIVQATVNAVVELKSDCL